MKKLLFVFLTAIIVTIVSFDAKSQTVGYVYKALAAEGCDVRYGVSKISDKYYIIVTISSDRMRFLDESSMMVRTANGEVLEFDGNLIDNTTESAGIISGNIVLPVTGVISMAQFEVTPEQFELLKVGIVKVRLSTVPIEHERSFKKDKIGRALYGLYIKAKNKGEDF